MKHLLGLFRVILFVFAFSALTAANCAEQTSQTTSDEQSNAKSNNEQSTTKESKAYVLLVFAFTDEMEDYRRQCASIERLKFERAFKTIKSASKGRVVVDSLVGKEASLYNITAKCNDLSQKAGEDDAIFIYIFTQSYSYRLNGEDFIRNALLPLSPSVLTDDPKNYGITRETIRAAISTRPHRLEVLVVDEAPTFVLISPYRVLPSTDKTDEVARDYSYLSRFLLESKGVVDVSSSSPYRGKEHDEPLAWCPLELTTVKPDPKIQKSCSDDRFSGTVFCNAFLELADLDEFSDDDLVSSAFVNRLADALQTRVERFHAAFFEHKPQNLTRFGRKGAQILVEEAP